MKKLLTIVLCLLFVPLSVTVSANDWSYDIKDENFFHTGTWNTSVLKTQKGNNSTHAV